MSRIQSVRSFDSNRGVFYAIIDYHGRRSPQWIEFSNATDRDEALKRAETLRDEQAREHELAKRARAEKRRKARASITNPYKVGDVLYNSWGWEQTNIDFYEVVATTARTVTLRAISYSLEETHYMQGRKTPCPGVYCGEPFRKTLQIFIDWKGQPGDVYIPMEHGAMGRYEGKPVHCSWYA